MKDLTSFILIILFLVSLFCFAAFGGADTLMAWQVGR
jgi:hypothetical protein